MVLIDTIVKKYFLHIIIWQENFSWMGQSVYYAIQTGKKAGIVLILESIKDGKYWMRLNSTIQHFNMPIDTWNVGNAMY
jgi:hypothetical protein